MYRQHALSTNIDPHEWDKRALQSEKVIEDRSLSVGQQLAARLKIDNKI
jgi:hypothetical protein